MAKAVITKPVTQVADGVVRAVVTVVVTVAVIKCELGNRALFRPPISNSL